ncbi:MAG TPA: hypothetical protein G4N92_05500 [Anaerolineae bacterium]|nr:hypothetical protein [Anaerolineae bacterium]
MAQKAIFEGLVYSIDDKPVSIKYIGEEPCYVVDDNGFLRHIPCEQVDRQVLDVMKSKIENHEEVITEQTSKMLGQEDIFTRAIIQNQLENIDQQLEQLFKTGLPESGRTYLGMMGFKIVIDVHGNVIKVEQPGMAGTDDR